jgi:hypothetical protein
MTVRVNKSSFNIREKLSELGRKFGLKGSELAAAETVQEAREIVSAGRKNMIINGACMINERFASSTYTLSAGTSYYPVDRFRSWASGGGQFTIQRSDNAPPGFKNSLMFTVSTVDSSIAAGDYYTIQQRVEGYNFAHLNWGTANAKPVTLSFWVKADVTGKYGISFWPSGQNHNYVTHYNINVADTWEYKTITIPGATSGTWLTTNGTGFGIWWDLGTGSQYETSTTESWGQNNKFLPTGCTKMIATNGAKFRMTGIQLEAGRNATEFEHRPYGEELALCQRYFRKFGTGAQFIRGATGTVYSSAPLQTYYPLIPDMRAIPTGSNSAGGTTVTGQGYNINYSSSPGTHEYVATFYNTGGGTMVMGLNYNQSNNGNANLPTSVVFVGLSDVLHLDAEL